MTHSESFFASAQLILQQLDSACVERLAQSLVDLRERDGRLFVLGVGGSAGNAGHAVNDFRKLCDIEAYAPTDNVSELTARTNDEGFETVFEAYIATSRASSRDALFVFSVGGGNAEHNVSVNLIRAIDEARRRDMKVFGITGRDGGYTKANGDEVVVIPNVAPEWTTPLSEGFQAVVWHALVSHPVLQVMKTKW